MNRESMVPEPASGAHLCSSEAEHAEVELGTHPFPVCRLKLEKESAEETIVFQRIGVHGIELSLNDIAVDTIETHLPDKPRAWQERIAVREHALDAVFPGNLRIDAMHPTLVDGAHEVCRRARSRCVLNK